MKASVSFVLCFDRDHTFPNPLPFCYVAGFNRSGFIHWGMDEGTFTRPQGTPIKGSFADARDYFIEMSCTDPTVELDYVFR